MKIIVSLLLITALLSCKKTTTTPTNNQIGIAYAGGTYTSGSSGTLNYTDYPYSDPNATIDVKYIDSFKLDFIVNTKLNLPNYLKHFTADFKNYVSETKTTGWYFGTYSDIYNKSLDSIQGGSFGLSMYTNLIPATLTINLVTKKGLKQLNISGFQRKN